MPQNRLAKSISGKNYWYSAPRCTGALDFGTTSEIFKSLISCSCPIAFEIKGKILLALQENEEVHLPMPGDIPWQTATTKTN